MDIAKPNKPKPSSRRTSRAEALSHENMWKPITRDPWDRWAPGQEPIREVEIARIVADDSDTLMIRMPRVGCIAVRAIAISSSVSPMMRRGCAVCSGR